MPLVPEIGINGWPLDFPHSGSAVYTRNLATWLPSVAPDLQFRLFVHNTSTRLPEVSQSCLSDPISPLDGALSRRLGKLAWETISVPLASRVRAEELLHYPYFAAPLLKTVPTVVTIHDVIPLAVEGYHRSVASRYYSRLMARAVCGAASVITVSEHARTQILRLLSLKPETVFVTPEAADPRFSPVGTFGDQELLQKYALPDRFILYLGGAERRKNLETLVRAWKGLEQDMRREGVKLVIVADFPPRDALYPDIPGLVLELELTESVSLVRSVDEDDKPALYRSALAFCFPSKYEGFGLPPLEALASGIPVIASNATSLPEVLGDAALLVDPEDIKAWTEALSSVVSSGKLRAELSEKGPEQAGKFSWRETALRTSEVYRRVLAG